MLLTGAAQAQTTLYGITNANAIFSMNDVNTPSSINGPYSITGMTAGQVLVGLDVRQSNGGIYALGYDSLMHQAELYTLTPSGTTYTATAVSGTLASMDLGLTNNAAIDFISTADNEIRVIGRNGNHYIMNSDNGTIMTTGTGTVGFAPTDLYGTGAAILAASAYTNSFYGADATQQVGYDAVNNVLVTFDAGNYANGFNNASTTIHSIGTGIGTVLLGTGSIGMDTWYDSAAHNNIVFMTGGTLVTGAHLYKYTLGGTSGVMTDVGAIGSGTLQVRDIAFAGTRDFTTAVTGRMMTALSFNMRNLLYFDAAHPENIRKVVSLSGMTAGQAMVGIDYAASGELYGLGYNSTAHTYQLYTIDSATGHVTAVNGTPASLNLGTDDGSGNRVNVAFRFISTASNRIRVIGNNGATNVQLDATNGTIAATNTATQYVTGDSHFGATANLTSLGYTGYNGDATTQMFGFDANTGYMVMFSNTNDNAGYGDGTSGFINTGLDLNSTLNLVAHNGTYNNAHMNIVYDQGTNSNVGYMLANYDGDSSAMQNYSVMYDLSSMLTAYHKGAAGGPVQAGKVGYGIPVKDVTATRYYTGTGPTVVATIGYNDLFVYPNPAISTARIMLPFASEGKVTVNIIDMNGTITRTYRYEPRSYQLDVDMSTLPMGVYSVRVSGKGIGEHNLRIEKTM